MWTVTVLLSLCVHRVMVRDLMYDTAENMSAEMEDVKMSEDRLMVSLDYCDDLQFFF